MPTSCGVSVKEKIWPTSSGPITEACRGSCEKRRRPPSRTVRVRPLRSARRPWSWGSTWGRSRAWRRSALRLPWRACGSGWARPGGEAGPAVRAGMRVGAIESVPQIGSPPSVASLRQRLGRSGRQGGPAVLRGYAQEPEIDARTPPQWALRSDLVEFVATVRLLVAGWCEPPLAGALHLSTLVQQVLSLIVQYG